MQEMTKQELRTRIKERISLMTAGEREAASEDVCRQIIASSEWHEAGAVWLYSALPDEVDLSLLVQDAWQSGKKVFLPAVVGNDLQIRQYEPQRAGATGRFGILEPCADCLVLGDTGDLDLAVIPGRAFTRSGLRMGRGRGYYDRILPSLRCPSWGVAFSCQIVEEIPTDPWDVSLDRVFVG